MTPEPTEATGEEPAFDGGLLDDIPDGAMPLVQMRVLDALVMAGTADFEAVGHGAFVVLRKGAAMTTATLKPPSIVMLPIGRIQPSPENDQLYRPVDPSDPEIIALADSIREHGIQEPLVLSRDRYTISGHRRYAAARLAGLREIPCRIRQDVSREGDPDAFLVLLREANRQRVKSFDERVREEAISADPETAYEAMIEHRRQKSDLSSSASSCIDIGDVKGRSAISGARAGMLAAVLKVIDSLRNFWPLSDRQIHYRLLNDPPLIHASKPASTYGNDRKSYQALTDLLTRARLTGQIPWQAIGDETRVVTVWGVWREPGAFIRQALDDYAKGYWRDLMQSQPNHVEIVGEKLTVQGAIRPVAMQYTIPYCIGRGFCSINPRHEIAQHFKKSGKEKLVLLLLSDHDPDGEQIAVSFARSMRDDFAIEEDRIHAVKVALTQEHVRAYRLPPTMQAKATSSNYQKFRDEHGEHAFELEALSPETLQKLLTEAIDAVLDVPAFNRELHAEKRDAAEIEAHRLAVLAAVGGKP